MKKIYLVFIVFLIGNVIESLAQDPVFTQFYANPVYLNPAFAGSVRCPRLVLNYRNQWPGIKGAFVTNSASYDQYLDAVSGGLGFQLLNDKAGEGALSTTNISGIYSYHLQAGRKFSINAGLQAAYFQRSVKWNELTYGDMIDDRHGFIYVSEETNGMEIRRNVDLSAGILGYSDKFFLGFTANHLTQPKEGLKGNESRLPVRYTAHAGAVIQVKVSNGEEVKISPNILFTRQSEFMQFNAGCYINKGIVTVGGWYRDKESFIILLGVELNMFKFGYSYDISVSEISRYSNGSHELSCTVQFNCRTKRKYVEPDCKIEKPEKRKYRMVNCPTF
ncbi:MAG: type IX secretion system membrane protein PorP/SprF [Bacteroidota bacterium]